MVQEINGLTIGADYTLSFWYRPRTNNGFNDNGINVYWGEIGLETLVLSIANQLARDYSDWVKFSLGLTATDSTMNLGFYAVGNQNTLGGFLDDVLLMPEPATLALFGFGLLGIGATERSNSTEQQHGETGRFSRNSITGINQPTRSGGFFATKGKLLKYSFEPGR